MPKRAVLVFADNLVTHLARRRLPRRAGQLFTGHRAAARLRGAADVHLFTTGLSKARRGDRVHAQSGANFAERIENATATLASLGYAEIVMIGRDCPELCEGDIRRAFAQLESKRLVMGPDHRGGCYLIAFRSVDRHLLRGIRWHRNTDCTQLCLRAGQSAVFILPVKHDIDSWSDLRAFARRGDSFSRLLAFLFSLLCPAGRAVEHFVDRAAQFIRVRGQMPPPAHVA